MKIFGLYLKEKIFTIIGLLCTFITMTVVFILYSVRPEPIIYAIELCMVFFLIYMIWDFTRFVKKYKELDKCIETGEINDFTEMTCISPIEKQYQEIIEKLIDEKRNAVEDNISAMTDLKDYYALWAHQIKTPIAASNLLLQTMGEEVDLAKVKAVRQEMFKIDFYVDAVMNYLRLDDISSDYDFNEFNIEDIVKKSVKKFANQFIGKHISINIDVGNRTMYTDVKWLGFIIEQLLSNAIKYTNEGGHVKIYMQGDNLVIEDDGIGISEENLPRIMEKGFTGYNGRMDKNSTGIGLYLSKKAANKLGLILRAESKEGEWTRMLIGISQNHKVHE